MSKVKAEFVSEWEEGNVYSDCMIDLSNGLVTDIVVSNEGEDYEYLVQEKVIVSLPDNAILEYIVEANKNNDYELSEDDIIDLREQLEDIASIENYNFPSRI